MALIVWYAFFVPPAVVSFQSGFGAEGLFAKEARVDSDDWSKVLRVPVARFRICLHRCIHRMNDSM